MQLFAGMSGTIPVSKILNGFEYLRLSSHTGRGMLHAAEVAICRCT